MTKKNKKPHPLQAAFSIIEVLVALSFVGLVIFILSDLSKSVINFKKSSSQTAALIELKTLTSTVARNPELWLSKMKSAPEVGSIYSSCLSEISTATGFTCPLPSNLIVSGDTRLEEYANGMHVIDTPIVDSSGKKIAGTLAAPHYMNSDGGTCADADKTNCALQSVGYFMRSNSATNQDPGSVRFVMKVGRNENANLAKVGNFPMKAQYMSVELGQDWKKPPENPAGSCPANTVQVGYLVSGGLQCINPTASCTGTNEVQIGINSNGTPKCQAPAAPCTSPTSFVVYDPNSGGLTCAATSPCPSGTFTGYYSGTGDPMCVTNPPACSSTATLKKVQMGVDGSGNAICATVPTCTATLPKLSFNGSDFVCTAETAVSTTSIPASNCPPGKSVTGFDSNGAPICTDLNSGNPKICNNGYFLRGLNTSNQVICEPLPDTTDNNAVASSTPLVTCKQRTKYSTGDAHNTICCKDGERAMAALAPDDPQDASFVWEQESKCVGARQVGKDNRVQLNCCVIAPTEDNPPANYDISRTISASTLDETVATAHRFECGSSFLASVTSISYTSGSSGIYKFVPRSNRGNVNFYHTLTEDPRTITATVVVKCTGI